MAGAHVSISKGLAHAVKMAWKCKVTDAFFHATHAGKGRDSTWPGDHEALLMKKHNFGSGCPCSILSILLLLKSM